MPDVPLMMRIVREQPGWCDDGGTRQTETCEDQIALRTRPCAGLDRPAARDPTSTNGVGAANTFAAHRHPLFDFGARCCAISPPYALPQTAGAQTLNRAHPSYRGDRPFDAVLGPPYRGVYDFQRPSTTAASPCRSGSPATCSHVGAQLRRPLADAGLRRDHRHPRRSRPHRRRHDHP